MMTDVRRRIDGSIDIEFYRDKGMMERRAEIKAFLKQIPKLGHWLVAAVSFAHLPVRLSTR